MFNSPPVPVLDAFFQMFKVHRISHMSNPLLRSFAGNLYSHLVALPFFVFFFALAFFAAPSFFGRPGFGCHTSKVSTASTGTIQTRKSPMVCGTAPGTWPLRNHVATVVYGFFIFLANSPAV